MVTSISILILILTTLFAYGQQLLFQKNVNPSASELVHNLNKEGDSLVLVSKTNPILQVDIFNTDFSEYFNVHSNNTKIDLKTLPIGDYIVQAIVGKKLIVMYLEKRKNVKISISFKEEKTIASEDESIKIGEKENILYYWVVSESNSNFGSTKTMKLEYKENVDKLISKNKLELKSEIGKNNKLLVYAIYNKSQFMTKQLRNSKYYKLVYDSKVFNVEPFYTSDIKK